LDDEIQRLVCFEVEDSVFKVWRIRKDRKIFFQEERKYKEVLL